MILLGSLTNARRRTLKKAVKKPLISVSLASLKGSKHHWKLYEGSTFVIILITFQTFFCYCVMPGTDFLLRLNLSQHQDSHFSTKMLVLFSRGPTARADADHHTGPGYCGRTGLQSGICPPSPRAQWDNREASRKEKIHK